MHCKHIIHTCHTARTFGSVGGVMRADAAQLAGCPGIGPTKVKRLHETFHQPFRRVLRPHAEQQGITQTAVVENVADGVPLEEAHEEAEALVTEDGLEAAVALTQAVVEVAARGQEEDGEESDGVDVDFI